MDICCSGRDSGPTIDYPSKTKGLNKNSSAGVVKTLSQTKGVRVHHKILLVGKTEADKSTAINMFVNLINQNQYMDPRNLAITQKINISGEEVILRCNMPEFNNNQQDSQDSNTQGSHTSKAFIYKLQGNNYDISLIDSPGLGDNKGTDADKENIRKIVAEIQKLSQLTCILYIHRSSDLRECSFVKYYLNQLKDLLPMEYKDNIVIGFMGACNFLKIDAMPVLRKSDIPVKKYVCFENDCLIHPDQIPTSINSQEYINLSQRYWDQNAQQFQKLINMIDQ